MIDLHCHILPGVDDGAPDLNESLRIARQLQQAGFGTVVATPHVWEGRAYLTCREILAGTRQVQETLAEAGLKLKVLPGAECYIFPDLPRWVREDKIMTLGNEKKYLLLELPRQEVPLYTEKVFFELQVMGVTPILAHPERNKELAATPRRLADWANKGIFLQLNLPSLNGRYGETVSRFAQVLLQNRLIHCLGSDAHRAGGEDAYRAALGILLNRAGRMDHEDITRQLPGRILAGEPLNIEREYQLEQLAKTPGPGFWSRVLTGKIRGRSS